MYQPYKIIHEKHGQLLFTSRLLNTDQIHAETTTKIDMLLETLTLFIFVLLLVTAKIQQSRAKTKFMCRMHGSSTRTFFIFQLGFP